MEFSLFVPQFDIAFRLIITVATSFCLKGSLHLVMWYVIIIFLINTIEIGYILIKGILTGISPHGFSVSINERDLGGYILVNAMDGFLKHVSCPSHLLREVRDDYSINCYYFTFIGLCQGDKL